VNFDSQNFVSESGILLSTGEPDEVESMRTPASSLAIALLLAGLSGAVAQDRGTLNPQPLPPLAHPDDPKTPARQLFGRKAEPTAGPSHVVGFYASGCLAGAEALCPSMDRLGKSYGCRATETGATSHSFISWKT
jgi:hypothetical protein